MDFDRHQDTYNQQIDQAIEFAGAEHAFLSGLIPHWAKDEKIGEKMINARAETITEQPSFGVCSGCVLMLCST